MAVFGTDLPSLCTAAVFRNAEDGTVAKLLTGLDCKYGGNWAKFWNDAIRFAGVSDGAGGSDGRALVYAGARVEVSADTGAGDASGVFSFVHWRIADVWTSCRVSGGGGAKPGGLPG